MRTIDWSEGKNRIIDRTRLPAEESVLFLGGLEEVAGAISSLRSGGEKT